MAYLFRWCAVMQGVVVRDSPFFRDAPVEPRGRFAGQGDSTKVLCSVASFFDRMRRSRVSRTAEKLAEEALERSGRWTTDWPIAG
jgi:hypothetical protein